MNFYSASLVVLLRINTCVPYNLSAVQNNITKVPSDCSSQVSKDNLTCLTTDKWITRSDVPYLPNSPDYKYRPQFSNGPLNKFKRSMLSEVWIPRPKFPLKGRLDSPAKFHTPTVLRSYVINRNIGKKINYNLFPLKYNNHYHDSTVSLTTVEDGSRYSKNDLLLHENDEIHKTTRKSSSTEYTTKFKEKNIFNVTHFFFDNFKRSLELFDSKFYQASFNKLIAMSPANQTENGISFVESGLFLYIALLTISTEVDLATKLEIDSCLMYPSSVMEKIKLLKYIIDWLPVSDNNLKFRWASRLVLEDGLQVSQGFVRGVAESSKLNVEHFNSTDTKDNVFYILNNMVDIGTGVAMTDTFIEDDFFEGFCSVLITTIYIRARWRAAPTVLNDTYPFKDGAVPQKSVRMIKLNDMMGYTELSEWNAEAIEIKYSSPGLTLLILLPRENSIRNLITCMKNTTSQEISSKMNTLRVAAILPIYTLRMTLLLPGKLRMMNITRLVDAKLGNNSKCGELRLSHAVQRLMFWAEAGRNAFKDDGIEWDEAPDVKLIADRPYLFYVRWKNVTLMNGNFVL